MYKASRLMMVYGEILGGLTKSTEHPSREPERVLGSPGT